MLITLTLYAPFHELGHWTAAYIDGVKVHAVSYTSIWVNEFSFSSTQRLVLFKAAGLLITFYPMVLIFAFLWRRGSTLWCVPYSWILASPAVSCRDFLNIGVILGSVTLGRGLYLLSLAATVMLMVAFVYEVLPRELIMSSLIEKRLLQLRLLLFPHRSR